MATGKTNARWIRVFVDDAAGNPQDISADVKSVGTVGLKYDEADVTGYSDGVKNVTLGQPSAPITMTGPVDNTATSGAHIVLSGIDGLQSATSTVLIKFGIKAAPTTGDPKFSGEYYCSDYHIDGSSMMWSATFTPGSGTAPAWGTV